MARYYLKVVLFRLISASVITRRLYREIGNRVRRGRVSEASHRAYLERGLWLVETIAAHSPDAAPRHMLDVGTGWSHFYSLFLALFHDASSTMFDVTDNRSLKEMRVRVRWLRDHIEEIRSRTDVRLRANAVALLESAAAASSINEVYACLNMSYVVDAEGSLDSLPDAAYDVLFSMDVLEHVRRKRIMAAVRSYRRVLRPGGLSLHQIGIDDHFSHGVPAASPKHYLRFSRRQWASMVSRLQYHNRLQAGQFQAIFSSCGFELIDCTRLQNADALNGVRVHDQWQRATADDLITVRAHLVHRGPAPAGGTQTRVSETMPARSAR
ncbi:MAG: class I SAM-dependent methyltransferase [Chloroflexi bacterium]|nr:class I SAM-dependent methyltransferase [Chloroflexota bacterium]